MRDVRLYHPEPLADGATVQLSDDAVRHALKVLRMRDGDTVTLFDGSGREWPATLVGVRGAAEVGAASSADRESPLDITLVQGISRAERMDATIQKAVELGVRSIHPVLTERSVVKLDAAKAARKVGHWRAVAVAACEQCGRNVVPAVAEPIPFADWVASPGQLVLVLAPGIGRPLAAAARDGRTPIALVVGPEGGLAPAEIDAVLAVGGEAVTLGPRTLRTETAGVAALAVLQAIAGDYR